MDLKKILDAYCYLKIKHQHCFEQKALKMLWFADVLSLRKYGRSISGCDLEGGIKELPDLNYVLRYEPISIIFGEMSRSDMMILDFVFLYFEGMSEEECDDFKILDDISLEGVLEGLPFAKELMGDIQENIALREYFREVGL